MDNTAPIALQEDYCSPENDAFEGEYAPTQHPIEKAVGKEVSGVNDQCKGSARHVDPASRARPRTNLATPKRKATTRQVRGSVPENKSFSIIPPFFRSGSSRSPKHPNIDHALDDGMLEYENEKSRMSEYIHSKELELADKERELLDIQQQMTSDHHMAISDLQAKLLKSDTEKRQIEETHIASVRKHQEAWFKHREKARWPAVADGDITHKLDKLKRIMRSWARDVSIKDLSALSSLLSTEHTAFMEELAQVALVENNELPPGLSTAARSPILLLNALLAHSVYMNYFKSPFFLFKDVDTDQSVDGTQDKLETIYQQAKQSNQKDAHVWRSDTLRLFMPPQRHISDTEKQMRNKTEVLIAHIADQHASTFLASPARHLIASDLKTDLVSKLKQIFNEAATSSYMLWTQRIDMRCQTLHDLKPLAFDSNGTRLIPDSLVRCEGQEEQFNGRMVTVMVHPLLEAYGTDEAEDYDTGRVWAAGVVWFDNGDGAGVATLNNLGGS